MGELSHQRDAKGGGKPLFCLAGQEIFFLPFSPSHPKKIITLRTSAMGGLDSAHGFFSLDNLVALVNESG